MEVEETEDFSKWLTNSSDAKAKAKVVTRLLRLADGNPGDVAPVGDGISELRIDHGPGYRVYYVRRKDVYVALCGGDKSTQSKDINLAKALAADIEGYQMARTKISTFDAAKYLDTPELVAEFLNEAFETNDPVYITKAVGIAARAKGMTNVSRESGLSRESLYRSLCGDSNPEFGTIVHVLDAMGIQLRAKAKAA